MSKEQEAREIAIFALIALVVSAFVLAFFMSASISRGDTIRAMCREMAAHQIYHAPCEAWDATRALHRALREGDTP